MTKFGMGRTSSVKNQGCNRFIGIIPNALTIGRLILTVVFFGVILCASDSGEAKPADSLLAAFIVFLVMGITDILDGKIARMYGASSKFGRMADPLADKFLVCGAFICFAIVSQPKLGHLAPLWLDPGGGLDL